MDNQFCVCASDPISVSSIKTPQHQKYFELLAEKQSFNNKQRFEIINKILSVEK